MSWANKFAFFMISAIVVFTTVAYGAVHQPVIALFYLLVTLVFIGWAIDAYLSGVTRFSPSMLQIPLIGAVIYGLIQIIPFGSIAETAGVSGIPRTISLDPFATQVTALHFFALFLFFSVTLVMLDSASRIRKLVTVLMIFGFVYAFFAILQSVLSPDKIYGIYESRSAAAPFGSFVNRHNFAAYMEMMLCLPLGLLFAGAVARDKRLLYITAAALMGVALLLSSSRGGFVAFLAEIIVLVLLTQSKSHGKLGLKTALSVLLIGAVVGGAFFVGGETSLTRIAETSTTEDVTTGRAHIWRQTVAVIKSNLPLGAGLGAFGVAYTPHDNLSGMERVEQAHNDYLQVLADAGIVGLLLGLFFVYLLIRLGLKAGRIENTYRRGVAIGAFAGCVAILVHSIFDFVLHTTAISILFLVLVSLLAASRSRYEDDIKDESDSRSKKRSSGSIHSISAGRHSTTGARASRSQ
jgi:O-antigen ligase